MIPLRRALRLGATAQVAFVGAGGKTTAMFRAARQFETPVLVTTSTHLSVEQVALGDQHVILSSVADIQKLKPETLPQVTVVTGPKNPEQRMTAVPSELLVALGQFARQHDYPLLIEADGARRLALKAPADHEPPIPAFVDTVVVVAGLSALGQPVETATHRPQHFAEVSGLSVADPVSEEAVTRMLIHPMGGLKNVPATAQRVALLNQADSPNLQATARRMAEPLLTKYDSVVVSSLRNGQAIGVHERIAGILLAAGASERLGRPKQLLDWHGKPFVRQVAETALAAGLSPVVVVTGADAEKIEQGVSDLEVKIVRNPQWRAGQSSSVKAGLVALGERVGGALFLVVDQPQLPVALIKALQEEHAASLAPIVATMVGGRRSNPVLFDRNTFPDFDSIEGDVGGRAIFAKHPVSWVPWLDISLAIDVDTMEDYLRLLRQTK